MRQVLEIRGAYNAALPMYPAQFSGQLFLFSPKERRKILALLERAYFTLINEKERDIYDNELIRTGILSAEERTPAIKKPVNILTLTAKG